MLIFTDGQDPELLAHLRNLLLIVAVLELFDGLQAVESGGWASCFRTRGHTDRERGEE